MPLFPPFDRLLEVIQRQDVILGELTPDAAGQRLRQETWLREATEGLALRAAQQLPTAVAGVRIDGTPVLLCASDGDATEEGIHDLLRRLRNQATIARSWLEAEAPNLQLFVALGAMDRPAAPWVEFARDIESDDRICRKLVWLVGQGGETPEDFVARTFLATPWRTQPSPGAAEATPALDALSNLHLPLGWEQLLANEDLDATALVQALANEREP